MKKIYICGASDCFPDPEFINLSWVEKLSKNLPDCTVTSLAIEGASNFLIHLQIDRALESAADYVIVNFTSSVRHEIFIGTSVEAKENTKLLDRFYRHHLSIENPSLMTLSVMSPPNSDVLTPSQIKAHMTYQKHFFDLDVAVQKNYYLIDHALQALIKSKIPFKFSQGGFEHPSYMSRDSQYTNCFDSYNEFKSEHNLWDYIDDFQRRRPYFHITDSNVNQKIADYYSNWITDLL